MSDPFSSPEALGRIWLEMSEPGKSFTFGPAVLGEARGLLAPIAALQLLTDEGMDRAAVVSVSERLGEKIRILQTATDISEQFLDDPNGPESFLWTDDKRDATEARLEELKELLIYCQSRALEAEKLLAAKGWRYDPGRRLVKATMTKGQKGNAPQHLVRRCIEALYETHPKRVDKACVCQEIHGVLARFFPEEWITLGPHGKIATAIEDLLKARPELKPHPPTKPKNTVRKSYK